MKRVQNQVKLALRDGELWKIRGAVKERGRKKERESEGERKVKRERVGN